MSIQELCNEVIICIFNHLKVNDILNINQTCKFYNHICFDDIIWKSMLLKYYTVPAKVFPDKSWYFNFKYLYTVKTLAKCQISSLICLSDCMFFDNIINTPIDTSISELCDVVVVHIPPKNNFVGVIKREHIYQISKNNNTFVFNNYPKTHLTTIEQDTLKFHGYLVQIHATNTMYIMYIGFNKLNTTKSYMNKVLYKEYPLPNLDIYRIIEDAIKKNIERIRNHDMYNYIHEIIRPNIICSMISHHILPVDISVIYKNMQQYIHEIITTNNIRHNK